MISKRVYNFFNVQSYASFNLVLKNMSVYSRMSVRVYNVKRIGILSLKKYLVR